MFTYCWFQILTLCLVDSRDELYKIRKENHYIAPIPVISFVVSLNIR